MLEAGPAFARSTFCHDRHAAAVLMDSKSVVVKQMEYATWLSTTRTTKARALTQRARAVSELRRDVLASSGISPRAGVGLGSPRTGRMPRDGIWEGRGAGRANAARSTPPGTRMDFGLVPTMHRPCRPSSAMARCHQALKQKPHGWLVPKTYQTVEDRLFEATERQMQADIRDEVREQAGRARVKAADAEGEARAAARKMLAERQALERAADQLREEIISWQPPPTSPRPSRPSSAKEPGYQVGQQIRVDSDAGAEST